MTSAINLIECDFELFAKALEYSGLDKVIYHVIYIPNIKLNLLFFQKELLERAEEDNIRGWCMYTSEKSFKGHIEGDRGFVEQIQTWLEGGTEKVKVQNIIFDRSCPIKQFKYADFKIRKKDQYF